MTFDPRADLEHLPDLNVFDIARNESAVHRELAIRILVERGSLYVSREEIAGEARQLVLDHPAVLKRIDPASAVHALRLPGVIDVAEEKTRRILFGRFAGITCRRHGLGKPETFEFLGFKHVCGVDRAGRFALIRIPSVKSCRKFLARTREWILHNRHWRRWEQQQHLTKMLRGFYQYFGLHHCERKLNWVRQQVQRQWHRLYWSYLQSQSWFELPYAVSTLQATV